MKIAYGVVCVVFCFVCGLPQASAAVLCSANPSNLVSNCGFETGDLTGWTAAGNDVPLTLNNLYGVEGTDPLNSFAPHSGSFQMFVADLDSNATTLSQTLPTIVGDIYHISFYLAQDTLPGTGAYSNEALLSFAGVSVAGLSAVPVEGYTLYSYTTNSVATTSSVFSLTLGNGLGEFLLDDVTVVGTAAPEPSAWILALAGFAAFVSARLLLGVKLGRGLLGRKAQDEPHRHPQHSFRASRTSHRDNDLHCILVEQ